MLNPEKVQLMAKTALFEKGSGGDNLKTRSFFEGSERKRIFKSVLFGSASYLLLMMLAFIVLGKDVINFAERPILSGALIGSCVVVGIVFVILYEILVKNVLKEKYKNTKSSLTKYDIAKKKLGSIGKESRVLEAQGEE